MLKHVIAPTRDFTQSPNALIYDTRLNGNAVRILTWALSLHPKSSLTLSDIGERVPEGRDAFRQARKQLVAAGYVHDRKSRLTGGRFVTQVLVSNVPLTTPEEVDAAFEAALTGGASAPPGVRMPPPGKPAGRAPGASTKVVKTGENTSHPEPVPAAQPEPAAEPEAPEAPEPGETTVRAMTLLSRLGEREAKLRLGIVEAAKLAPLAAQWLANGASEVELRNALASGLPPEVHSPVALLTHRLKTKLPAPRSRRDPAAPPPPRPECAGCDRPLPPDQTTGICGRCAGVAPPPPPQAAGGRTTTGLARVRTALREARTATP